MLFRSSPRGPGGHAPWGRPASPWDSQWPPLLKRAGVPRKQRTIVLWPPWTPSSCGIPQKSVRNPEPLQHKCCTSNPPNPGVPHVRQYQGDSLVPPNPGVPHARQVPWTSDTQDHSLDLRSLCAGARIPRGSGGSCFLGQQG